MVVDDFDFMGVIVLPQKTNPPLIIDADRVLSAPLAGFLPRQIGSDVTVDCDPEELRARIVVSLPH